jgi:hypothetical protein
MIVRHTVVASVAAVLALTLAACGQTTSETAEVTMCKKIAQAALHNPQALTVVDTRINETSEGDEIFLEIEYKAGDTEGHVWDRCWFVGYGDSKKLKNFAVRESQTASYVVVPAEELAAIQDRIVKQ